MSELTPNKATVQADQLLWRDYLQSLLYITETAIQCAFESSQYEAAKYAANSQFTTAT